MKFAWALVLGTLVYSYAAPSFAADASNKCKTADAVPAILIVVTPDPLSTGPAKVLPETREFQDASLICVAFHPATATQPRRFRALQFISLINPNLKEEMSFTDFVNSGWRSVKKTPLGKINVSKISCVGCKDESTQVELKVELLTSFLGQDWAKMPLVLEFPLGGAPVATFKGEKFDVMTIRSWKSTFNGGTNAVRFSECKYSDFNHCLGLRNPEVKHFTPFVIKGDGRYGYATAQ